MYKFFILNELQINTLIYKIRQEYPVVVCLKKL